MTQSDNTQTMQSSIDSPSIDSQSSDSPTIDVPETEKHSALVALRLRTIRTVASALAGLDRCFGDRVSEGFGMLMYHRCCERPSNSARPTMNVTPQRLEQQLQGLLDRGFIIRPLPEVISDLERGLAIDRKTLVVTFDDGFAGMHRYVLPILKRLDITASVFVCTKFIGSNDPMPFDPWGQQHAGLVDDICYRSVNDRECQELVDSGHFDIGAHTHSHEDFRGRPADFEADMTQCVRELQERFGIKNPTFAFPFGTPALGYSDSSLVDAAKRVGIRSALTTAPHVINAQTDRFALGRFNAFQWDTAATLQARLHGWYSWLPAASAAVRSMLRKHPRKTPSKPAANRPDQATATLASSPIYSR